MKTLKELLDSGLYTRAAKSLARGYVSRKIDVYSIQPHPYEGKYGKGYMVHLPNHKSSRYCFVEYYVEK